MTLGDQKNLVHILMDQKPYWSTIITEDYSTFMNVLVMGLRDDRGEGGGGPLPGQHLVLDLPDFFLEVPGGGVHGLPDTGVVQLGLSLPGSTELLLT